MRYVNLLFRYPTTDPEDTDMKTTKATTRDGLTAGGR